MQKYSKYLPIAFFLGFFLLGLSVFLQSKPAPKNARIYQAVQPFSPYHLEKSMGGLQIIDKNHPEIKRKPDNTQVFKALEGLEKAWGEQHLKIKNNTLFIYNAQGTPIKSITIHTQAERDFIQHYYGVTP